MNEVILTLGWIGIYSPMALGAIGSMVGCAIGGMAACGAMLETESGYGRFVGVSAMPSSQTIYGIVVMLSLNRAVSTVNAPALFGIGATITGMGRNWDWLSGDQRGGVIAGLVISSILLLVSTAAPRRRPAAPKPFFNPSEDAAWGGTDDKTGTAGSEADAPLQGSGPAAVKNSGTA